MPNANYVRGAAFERQVMERLNLLGWTCWRSAGSHSPADVVALRTIVVKESYIEPPWDMRRRTEALLCQCKAGRTGRLSEQDRAVFIAYAQACGATACLADQVQGIGVRVVELESGRELG